MTQSANQTAPVQSIELPDFDAVRAFLLPTQNAGRADVFQTVDWFENLARHGLADGVRPWLLGVAGGAEGPRLVLPLARAPNGLISLSNYYSSLYGVVGQTTNDAAPWLALATAMRADRGGAVIRLQPLVREGAWVAALSDALRTHRYWVDDFLCFGNWYLPVVHAGFDDYFAQLPSALRHSIGRGQRRLRAQGHALQVFQGAEADLEAAIDAFVSVYARSWKEPEPCVGFMPALMRTAARLGWLRLGVLRLQGEPVAAQLWLVCNGKANIYKLAYVQGFERYSPGSVLTAALMQHVIDLDRVSEIDYLTGDDAYKRDWMSHRRERVGLVAFDARRPRAWLAALQHFGGRWLRRRCGR